MNHLIVYSHPNPQSFNKAILNTYQEALQGRGHKIQVRDLYAMDFDPVLSADDLRMLHGGQIPPEIKAEQDLVRWADVMTLICPIWWGGFTANLRGYIDRVFSLGFAYEEGPAGPKGLLGGKKMVIINTMGAPYQVYERIGMIKSMGQVSDECISQFCGLTVMEHKYFGNVVGCSAEERRKMLHEVKILAESI
jgi:NAD(P)H dehydrogenase (quinone)